MDDKIKSFDTGTDQYHTAPTTLTHEMLVDNNPLAEFMNQIGDDENQPPEVSWTWTVDNAQVNFTPALFYQLINQDDSKLGDGSFGTVYRYDCSETGKTVAIKKIRANVGRKQVKKYINNFSREISVHMNLDHINVLQFIDKIEFDEVFALVVEFAEKGSLSTLMGSGELERKKIIYYSEQILRGLEYLHNYTYSQEKRTIVHKDLRCDNVLMDKHGIIKLADFGISKALNLIATTSGIQCDSQSLVGNPFWNAPEQIRNVNAPRASQSGRPIRCITAKDIWSLGVLMLEMYYYGKDRVPFMRHYTSQTYIYNLSVSWIPKVPNMAPSELKSILKRCFSYEPEDRPTASDLLEQIKTFKFERKFDIGELGPIIDLDRYGYPERDSELDYILVDGFGSDEIPGVVNDPDPSELDYSTDEEDSRFLDRSFQRLHELTTMYKDDEGKGNYHTLTKNTTDLAPFHTKTEIILQLEDNYYSTSYYDIRELNGACDPQDLFKMFIDTGYCGYQHDLLYNDRTLLSFSTTKDTGAFLTTKGRAGGIAKASHSSQLKKKLKLTDKRMKMYPITPEGNKVMRALSPRPSRKIDNPGSPGSSSTSIGRTPMSLRYEDLTLSINRIRNGHYDYVIKFKEDDVDVAYIKLNFSKSNNDEKDGCLIKVLPENNKALVSTVAAYYYWHKAKQRKRQTKYHRFVSYISSEFGYYGGTRSRLL